MVDFRKVPYTDYSKRDIGDIVKVILTSIGHSLPIDVDLAIEKKGLNLIPTAGLKDWFSIDAYLSLDKKTIYYDPDVTEVRIRFSLAHEFGHFNLHKKLIEESHIESTLDWKDYIKNFPEWMWAKIESQANIFAAELLAPKSDIEEEIRNYSLILSEIKKKMPNEIDSVRDYVAVKLSKTFHISDKAMNIRMKDEKINPYDYIV